MIHSGVTVEFDYSEPIYSPKARANNGGIKAVGVERFKCLRAMRYTMHAVSQLLENMFQPEQFGLPALGYKNILLGFILSFSGRPIERLDIRRDERTAIL